jgi:hypothetical protein
MRINLTKNVFTRQETDFIIDKLEQAEAKGLVTRRYENNIYLLASFKGVEEKGITRKWNVKIYTYNWKKRGHSLVCVDKQVLGRLLAGDYEGFVPPDLELLRIDDAGWGFPLCGVMVGVSDEQEVRTAVVPVEYFRDDTRNRFGTKRYLKAYASLAISLLDQFEATPDMHRVEICTGYINQPLRERLRKLGYDVRVAEIRGRLQEELEGLYRAYVRQEIGADIYYDPKDMKESEIPRRYYACLRYGRRHCPDKIKTGWSAISGPGDEQDPLKQFLARLARAGKV